MVGMTKGKYRKIRIKKTEKVKKPQKAEFKDYILALVNVSLLFPVVWILSVVIAEIIRFLLKILMR